MPAMAPQDWIKVSSLSPMALTSDGTSVPTVSTVLKELDREDSSEPLYQNLPVSLLLLDVSRAQSTDS